MIIILLPLIFVSILPSIFLYRWFKKISDDEKYKELCKEALVKGIKSVLWILLASCIFYIIGRLSGLKKVDPILYQVYYNFIVLAGAEEMVKFLTFKKLLKNNEYAYSWFNVTIFMIIIGIGFGCIENVVYALESDIIVMTIRGLCLGHGGYGFIMGWFYGKRLKTGKKIYGILAFIIPWLLHGFYDFGLCPELLDLNDNFAIISVSLAVVSIILVFRIIKFVKKKQKVQKYIDVVEI